MSEINVDPMKKSSIYATFGRYYGEKLYKLLYDCCSGRPGSFCYEIKKCSRIEVTYNELVALINTNSLIPGNTYLITDFKTVTYIQYSGSGIGNEEIYKGNIEPMLVHAIAPNKVDTKIESTIYPTDIITWKPFFQDREWDAVLGQSTGVITSREDTLFKIKRDFDFRNIIFRRWETINESGIYDSVLNTGFAYHDYPPFTTSGDGSYNCYIGSPLIANSIFGIPYWLDNTIGKQSTSFMNIEYAYGNNIEGFFDTNANVIYCVNNKVSGDFIYNKVGVYFNNDVALIDSNKGATIRNNDGNGGSLSIINNAVSASIIDNSFDGVINRNYVVDINSNVSSLTGCLIKENTGIEINNNVEFKNIENNIINFITDTDFGGKTLKDSSGNSFRNNIIDQDILNNNFLASIYGKTFTPTAGMQSINPSVTLWDNTSGDVEQILTAGVLSYVSF